MDDLAPKSIRVRFAPSPTGLIHIGSVHTALFNWLFARKYGGTFILRIEDTDKERSEKKYEDEILRGLSWMGLDWDEGPQPTSGADAPLLPGVEMGACGPYRQSERGEIYKKYLAQLIASGDAYYCYCTKEDVEAQRQAMLAQGLPPKYNGHCRTAVPPEGKTPEVIRFKVPEIKVTFNDLIRGTVTFDAALFGDIIIAKNLDAPLYNFAVVVDDALMQISHVIRAEDHLSNTPKQILMVRALGFSEPIYAHIPLILNADRSKMSKRFSDTALMNYRDRGYVPEAMVNFLALLGWHPKGDEEILSRQALIAQFDIARVQQSGAIFNEEKLDWLNREHIKTMPVAEVAALAAPFFAARGVILNDEALFKRVIGVQLARAKTLEELAEISGFFFAVTEYEAKLLLWKETSTPTEVVTVLDSARAVLEKISGENFTQELLSEALPAIVGDRSRGIVLWPLRVALSGQARSPDPIEIMAVLGKEEALKRISIAIKKAEMV